MRKELGMDVEMVKGHYGEFKVLVDGETAIDGGALAVMGVLPSRQKIFDAVRERLSATEKPRGT